MSPYFVSILITWRDGNSSVRGEWLKRADEMTLSDNRTQKMPGLEFWFTPLDSSAPASCPL